MCGPELSLHYVCNMVLFMNVCKGVPSYKLHHFLMVVLDVLNFTTNTVVNTNLTDSEMFTDKFLIILH